jgi:hypothetical protein
MHLAKRTARIRRALSLVTLIAVLGVGSVTLTQCRMVGDRLTGVEVDSFRGRPTECSKACRRALEDALEEEYRLYFANLRACNRNKECLKAEFERHLRRLAEIWKEYEDCLAGCHHQGGGTGG